MSLVPGTQTLRPGDMLRLSCSVRGAPQPRIAWSKIQGQLSPFATITRGTLEILSVAANDAGQYRCQVTDSDGRISDAFAEVIIRGERDLSREFWQPFCTSLSNGSGNRVCRNPDTQTDVAILILGHDTRMVRLCNMLAD